jgi:PAS domain S-box-containing protein
MHQSRIERPLTSNSGRTLSFVAGLFATAVGLVVLIGWTLEIEPLKSIVGSITTKANMGLSLIACGLALAIVARGATRFGGIATALAIFGGAIGALTFSQHVFGWNLGIDELLFTEAAGAEATTSPGRSGPNGSLSLVLASLALLSLRAGTSRGAARAQFLAAGMAILATIPLIGYWFGAEQLYDIARYTGIGFSTAFTLLVLSLGIMTLRLDAGPIAVLTSDGSGAVMARRLLVPGLALPLVFGYLELIGQRAGYYDTGLGTGLFAISLATIFVALIWRTARHMNTSDSDRRQAEAASRASERSFSSMFRSLPVSVTLARVTDGTIVDANEAFTELSGFAREEVLGKTGPELGLIRDLAARQRFLDEVRRTGVVRNAEIRWFPKTGAPRDVITNFSIIELQGTQYILSTVLDFTERKNLETQQAAAREAAESANRLKDQFLATLSHELRTPLNAILGYARMLHTNAIPPDKRERAIEIIERNAVAQNQLVEDLLDISRITTGKVRLDAQPVLVVTPLREALESLKPAAEAKRIALEIETDPFVGTVNGDQTRLQQIFWNVLSNAVKFTPEGGRIVVQLDLDGSFVRVTVRDTGIGISPEFLPYLFEPFRQADGRFSREFGGLGLGLAICRQLVELHGGTIHASSAGAGHGTTLTVRLPQNTLSAIDVERPSFLHTASPLQSLTGVDVLVVDDEEDTLELLRQIVESAGATVRTAISAEDAIHEWETRPPDLLVTDLGLPSMDGYELLRQIRARPTRKGTRTPAVAVTAYARLDDRKASLAAGFQHHISKPIDPDAFVAVLAAAVHHHV